MLVEVWVFSGYVFAPSFAWSVLVWSVSCNKQSANILNRFWVGTFGLLSIPALMVAVGLKSEIDVDLDLRLTLLVAGHILLSFFWPSAMRRS